MNSKLFLIAVAFLLSTFSISNAQNNAFGKGDFGLNLNYGIGAFTDGSFGGDDLSGSIFQNSLGASIEYGIMEGIIKGKGTIAVGGQFGYGFNTDNNVDYTRIRIATRGVFHYQFVPQLDTYAGVTCGIVDINKIKVDYISESYSHTRFVYPCLFAGARYMFSNNFGINSEVSWDEFAFCSFGVSFKF